MISNLRLWVYCTDIILKKQNQFKYKINKLINNIIENNKQDYINICKFYSKYEFVII